MSKNLQPSIDGTKMKKERNLHNHGYFPWRELPFTDQKGDEYAVKLLDYVNDEKIHALKLTQFLRYVNLSSDTFYALKRLSRKLQEAHKWALMIFGERRELGMLEGRYNAQGSMKVLPRYDAEWRAQMINEAKLKAIAAIYAAKATAGTFNAADLEIIDHMYDELEKADVGNDPDTLEQVHLKTLPESTD